MKPYLLMFYTEGEPYDNGLNLCSSVKDAIEKIGINFEHVFVFNRRSLKKLPGSEEVCNEYPEMLHPLHNTRSNMIGYFDFKPFLIDHVLNCLPEDAILIYHDSNFSKYSQYYNTDWKIILNLVVKNDIFVSVETDGLLVKNCVKIHTLKAILESDKDVDFIKEKRLLAASRVLMRNTEFTRKFIREWLAYMKDKSLILGGMDQDPDFKWNCGDQDVLNCLIYKYALKGDIEFPNIFFGNREWNLENFNTI